MSRDFTAEANRLQREYTRAVGIALDYGIKVYEPGGSAKDLGTLRDEIAEHEGRIKPSVFEVALAVQFDREAERRDT